MNNNLLDINKVKTFLVSKMLWRWNYLGVATESLNNSDVLGIRRTLYAAEFEIKLTRSDLLNEVNIILNIIKSKTIFGCHGSNTKVTKHGTYLGYWEFDRHLKEFIPNEFNFLVPIEFEDIKTKLENSPYGLYTINIKNNNYGINQILRPKKLHKNKISNEYLPKFFRKLSTENQMLREKLYIND